MVFERELPSGELRPARGAAVALLLALVAGTWLRVAGLGEQLPQGDEFHGIRAAGMLDLDYRYLATHNAIPEDPDSDFSSPLTLWSRFLVRNGGLDEWGMRALVLASGVGLLVVVAAFAWRRWRGAEGSWATWLVAVSPVFLMYSRVARPYMPAAFCTTLALLTWCSWRERPARWRGLVWAFASAGALYFSLTAAPAILALWAYALLDTLRHRRDQLRQWLVAAAVGAATTTALLLPSLLVMSDFLGGKVGESDTSLAVWWTATTILFGSTSGPVVVALLAVTALGAVLSSRSRGTDQRSTGPRSRTRSAAGLAPAILIMTCAQGVGVLVLSPLGVDHAIVLARYLVVPVPGLLLLTGFGLAGIARGIASAAPGVRSVRGIAGALFGGAALAGLIHAGPIYPHYLRRNAFTSDPELLNPLRTVDPARIPSWYHELSEVPDDVTVVEVPWVIEWELTPYPSYQAVHGKRVKALTAFPSLSVWGVEFDTIVPWNMGNLRMDGCDYVVIHHNVIAEQLHVTRAANDDALDTFRQRVSQYTVEAGGVLEWCREVVGYGLTELVHEDEWVTVYRLEHID